MKISTDMNEVEEFALAERVNYESELKSLVEIPSVSMDPAHRDDVFKIAETATALLKHSGAFAEIISTRGNPVVFGHYQICDNAPTVLVYNHLDVQPADAAEWNTPPFKLVLENGVYRGRGTTDDKGPALAVLYAAKYIYEHKIPINIKFVWELEEEIGSPSFQYFLQENKSLLAADSIVISDTIWVSREKPAIPYGLRGMLGVLLRLKTGQKDVHSGTTGGLARNPIGEMAEIISRCYEAKTGRVHIPGFYDDVCDPTELELGNFTNSGFSLDQFQKAHELISLRPIDRKIAAQKIWAHPTFELHGIVGGYTGPGIKSIVPCQAEAKISMRLVPNQEAKTIFDKFRSFVKEICPDVEVHQEGVLKPYLGQFNDRFNQAASKAMHETFAIEPAFTREGGSIGAVVSMHEELKVPIVFLGLSLPEHGYHAINENFDWQQAKGGIKLFINYFKQLSSL
jgi:acetylornithine deacetylase/succinyl-diaminopimelate desuccinylase-like protein